MFRQYANYMTSWTNIDRPIYHNYWISRNT